MSFGCHSFLLSPSLLFPRRHEGAHSRAPAWLIPQAAPSGCTAVEADPAVPEPWTGVPYAVGLFTPSPSHPPTPGDPTPFAADACFCPTGPACSASALLPPAPMVPTGSVGPRFCPGSADSPAAQEDPRLASESFLTPRGADQSGPRVVVWSFGTESTATTFPGRLLREDPKPGELLLAPMENCFSIRLLTYLRGWLW